MHGPEGMSFLDNYESVASDEEVKARRAKNDEEAERQVAELFEEEPRTDRTPPRRRTQKDITMSRRKFAGIVGGLTAGAAVFGPRIFSEEAGASVGKKDIEADGLIKDAEEVDKIRRTVKTEQELQEERERIAEREEYLKEFEDIPKEAFEQFDLVGGRIDDNLDLYRKAAEKFNVPWEFLAALHYRETKCSRKVPENGQGIFQVYSRKCPFKAGSYLDDDQMLQEIEAGLKIVDSKVGIIRGRHSSLSREKLTQKTRNKEFLKEIFFHYNGTAYDTPENSPYVMNFMDKDHMHMPIISQDKGKIDSLDKSLGAYPMYVMLKVKYMDKIKPAQQSAPKG